MLPIATGSEGRSLLQFQSPQPTLTGGKVTKSIIGPATRRVKRKAPEIHFRKPAAASKISVHLATVRDDANIDQLGSVVNRVNDAPISNPKPPQIAAADEFFTRGRPWLLAQRFGFRNDAAAKRGLHFVK